MTGPGRLLLAVIGWSWAWWGAAALVGQPVTAPVPLVFFLLGSAGPLVVTLWAVRRAPAEDRRRFWRRVVHPGGIAARWWVVIGAVGLAPAVAAMTTAAAFGAPVVLVLGGVGGTALFAVAAGLVEEPAWRGVVLDGFPERGLGTALWIGAVWALWHLPLYAVEGTFQHGVGLGSVSSLALLSGPLPWSVLLVWLVNSTGGRILPAVLVHALGNLGGELFTPTAQTRVLALGFLTAVALAIAWATRGTLAGRSGEG